MTDVEIWASAVVIEIEIRRDHSAQEILAKTPPNQRDIMLIAMALTHFIESAGSLGDDGEEEPRKTIQ